MQPKAHPAEPPARRRPVPKDSPKAAPKQALKVDPERYPDLAKNPSLERALRIQQALAQGKPRDEAVQLADAVMGRRALQRTEAHVPQSATTKARRAKKGR